MPDQPKSKLIVDDDWKSRVQAEKEAASNQQPADVSASRDSAQDRGESLPPASFSMLVTTLATQALAALGQFPMEENEQPVVMIDHAKHFIDTLAVLADKTKGNLTQEESDMLDNVLHELRMVYVAISSRA